MYSAGVFTCVEFKSVEYEDVGDKTPFVCFSSPFCRCSWSFLVFGLLSWGKDGLFYGMCLVHPMKTGVFLMFDFKK